MTQQLANYEKQAAVPWFEILTWNLPVSIEENYENCNEFHSFEIKIWND
jgi:hypothetical protein